ncbi:hypothetical protein ABPG75_008809 [Micractinium tetrahymenae]
MNDKRALEDFRVRQHAGPHPALAAAAVTASAAPSVAAAAEQQAEQIVPDSGRVILLFDVDSFYCQVEELRNPALRGRPLGVTQKYLIVTCNYAAREQGVTKLMGTAEARKRCPHIALVSGEDLTPYRAASKSILSVLQRFGTAEKGGLDEFWVDATELARRRLAALGPAAPLPPWRGHVHSSATPLLQDSRHRPMDLRAASAGSASSGRGSSAAAARVAGAQAEDAEGLAPGGAATTGAAGAAGVGSSNGSDPGGSWEALLRIGSVIASEARSAVKAEAGFRTSAGIACNKMLSKLCSGLHKPDDQTVMPPPEAAAFVAPLPVRALPGVGYKLEGELTGMGITTALQLRALPRAQLVQRFGERTGAMLHAACRGQDPSPVHEKGRQKSVTVEDSCKSCAGFAGAEKVVAVLAPDLLTRLQEELEDGGRRAATLTVKWRHRGTGWQRTSASCPMPPAVLSKAAPQEQQVAALASAAMGLLRRHLQEPFDLTLINLGATSFSDSAAAGSRDIAAMFVGSRAGAGASQAAGASTGASAAGGAAAAAAAAAARPAWQQPGSASLPSPEAARAAAEASAQQRRSYSAAAGQVPLLSKRHERQLREQGGLEPGVPPLGGQTGAPLPGRTDWDASSGQAAAGAGAAAAAQQGLQAEERVQRQPQPHAQVYHGDSFHEQAEDEDGSRMWDDLQRLAAWRSDDAGSNRGSGRSRGRSPSALGNSAEPGQPQLSRQQSGGAAAHAGGSSHACGPAVPLAAPASGRSSPAAGSTSSRVIIHADVDAFYVQVERLDDPSLVGVPVAVQQFNAGGFVAVSYEARAAGIRCGDGAGAAGRAAIPHLQRMQAASVEECRRRCPGLQVRPMRTDRCREVSQQVHDLLRSFAPDGQVERTSYDDCYLDVTAACAASSDPGGGQQQAPLQAPPAGLLMFAAAAAPDTQHRQQALSLPQPGTSPPSPQQWAALAPDLRRGVQLAAALRAAARERLGLTISCGVARSKLVARLASPLGKPDGLIVVPDAEAVPFMRGVPLHKVPTLRGKFGQEVASQLGISSVAQLAAYSRAELVRRFGEQQGTFLAGLPLAQDDTPVRERGPQKSILAERSFPPLPSEAAAGSELMLLARTLLGRAAQDTCEHRRLPCKLIVSYRQGYGSNPRSKSCPVPAEVLRWLQAMPAAGATPEQGPKPEVAQQEGATPAQQVSAKPPPAAAAGSGQQQAPAGAVVAAALAQLRPVVAPGGWQLTRLAMSLAYDSGGSAQPAGPPPGQLGIAAFVQKGQAREGGPASSGGELAAAAAAAVQRGGGATAGCDGRAEQQAAQPCAQPSAPPSHQQQQQQHPQKQQQQQRRQQQPAVAPHRPAQQQRAAAQAAPPTRPPSYRNAEALALQQMFGGSATSNAASGQPAIGSSSGGGGCPAPAESSLSAGLSPEEQASLELALKLQAEEAAAAAAAPQAARKRGPAGKLAAGGKAAKHQRRGSGPLDAFLRRASS